MPIDPSARVSPSAHVSNGAEICSDVEIGPFCIIEEDVKIGPRSILEAHVCVKRWTTLGADNRISSGTVLGTHPLDRSFSDARSYLVIGDRNHIREHYTISRGTQSESVTTIGDDNYIMTSGHIAHNCKIGSGNVICSCALIAGYVEIEDQTFISGGVGVHQFSKIGRLAMIGGNTRVNKDAPPYFLYSDLYITPNGVNTVGLKRAGFSENEINTLRKAYRLLFRSDLPLEEALTRIGAEVEGIHARHLVDFIRRSERGICKR